jgi:hypothetical protein
MAVIYGFSIKRFSSSHSGSLALFLFSSLGDKNLQDNKESERGES